MATFIHFKPPPASVSQPSYLSVARITPGTHLAGIAAHPQPPTSTATIATIASVGIASDSIYRKFPKRNYREVQQRINVAEITDPASERYLPRAPIRVTDLIQKQGNSRGAGSYLSDSDDDDEFPPLEQLLANAERKRILANAKPNIGEKDNRIQNNSLGCYSGSTSSNCQDPIYISDDESDTTSEIDYSDLGPDFTSEADCNHPFDADGGLKGGQALPPGTAPPFDRPATDYDDDETNKNNDANHNVQIQPPAGGYKSALFRGGSSVLLQARELQHNTKVTTDTTKHVGRESADDSEDYFFDVFAEEDGSDDINAQQKQKKYLAVSDRNSSTNTKTPKHQNAQCATKSLQTGLTAASLQQSDLKRAHPLSHSRPQQANIESKAARISAFGNESTASGSITPTGVQPLGKSITDPSNLWNIHMILDRKIIRRKAQFCVEWDPTWHPESELHEMKELLDEYDAKLQKGQRQSEGGREKRDRKVRLTTPNKLWKVRNIIGRRIIGDKKQYWVDWKPTWEPELDLTEAKELIDEFVAKLENTPGRRGKQGQKRSQAATEDSGVRYELEASKRRRRV